MNNKNRLWRQLKLSLLTMTCFLFVACPEAHFTTYKLDTKNAELTSDNYYVCEIGTLIELEIKVGYFFNYDRRNYRGPIAIIKQKNDATNAIQFIKRIHSANYGTLVKLDSLPDDIGRMLRHQIVYLYGMAAQPKDFKVPSRKASDLITIYTAQGKNFEFISK